MACGEGLLLGAVTPDSGGSRVLLRYQHRSSTVLEAQAWCRPCLRPDGPLSIQIQFGLEFLAMYE